uniref:Uncharacterized protein n=1 Tax=Kwoniella pini CBS 10737 TaxID=1296096 RepID=A0A1B9I1A1_9TREE|nr:uncharacterized protein I206_04926 [Kwoniella pini CBS 10737]OCF49238.1 hypothetical protein I206_04926 [Kwoniella pini CBS 10737]
MSLENHIPATLPHKFNSDALANHFANKPLPEGACALIDLPGDEFRDTEDEVNVIAASLWMLCVKYDNMPAAERPTSRDNLRRWISRHREEVIQKIAGKVEPPFHAWTMDQMEKDVSQMLDEVLAKTLPVEKDAKGKK